MTQYDEDRKLAKSEALIAAERAWDRMTEYEKNMTRIGLLPAWIDSPEFRELCDDGRAVAVAVFAICNSTDRPMVV